MSCNATKERLSEYIDRQLTASEASDVERHLAQCAPCRAELQDLRRAIAAVAALPRVRAPRSFAAEVAARIASESRAPAGARGGVLLSMSRHLGLLKMVSGIAAVFLVYFSLRALGPSGVAVPTRHEPIGREDTRPKPGELELKKAPLSGVPGTAAPTENSLEGKSRDKDAGASDSYGRNIAAAGGAGGSAAPEEQDRLSALKKAEKDAERSRKSQTPNLAVQRITVFSSDITVDSRQVQTLLGDTGYTYSVEDTGTIRVRVPASRATELVAALGKVPGGFRAEERKVLLVEEAEKRAGEAPESSEAERLEGGVIAEKEQLEKVLRRHLDESNKEIAKAKSASSKPMGVREGKQKEGRMAAGGGAGMTPAGAKGDDPALRNGDGQDWKGGRGDDGRELADGPRPAPPSAPADADRNEDADPAKAGMVTGSGESGAGHGQGGKSGSDSVEEQAKQEQAQDDQVADALKMVEDLKRNGAAEEAVFLVIEFRAAPAGAAPAAEPARK